MIILTTGLGMMAGVLLLPTLSDLTAIVRRMFGGSRRPVAANGPAGAAAPRLLFLVPAHDEELLIQSCREKVSSLPATIIQLVVLTVLRAT